MKKIYYRILAFSLALYFFFGSPMLCYVEAKKYEGWRDCLWNEDATTLENLAAYGKLAVATAGVYFAPTIMTGLIASLEAVDFYNFMTSDLGIDPETEEGKEALKNLVVFDDKSQEFTISNSFNNSMHTYITNYLKETTGYHIVQTMTPDMVPISWFTSKDNYNSFIDMFSSLDEPVICWLLANTDRMGFLKGGYNYLPYYFGVSTRASRDYQYSFSTWLNAYNNSVLTGRDFRTHYGEQVYFNAVLSISDDWTLRMINNNDNAFCFTHYSFDDCTTENKCFDFNKQALNGAKYTYYEPLQVQSYSVVEKGIPLSGIFYKEKISVKVWKSIDDFKRYDIGQQPYYTSQAWNNYDYSQDNSKTISTSTVDNSIKDSNNNTTYNEIVNNTTNGMTEKEVADLVETILKNQNNGNGGNGGNGTGTGGSGSGLSDLLGGIASLFDFFASLIGNIISMISNFLTTLIDSLGTFTSIFDGFSEFLSSAFGFIPKEAIAVIISGVTAIVVLAIIKFLKG